ncbi:MAG: S9 family peptidase [Gammaproteobacteria bacterium]|nr:S9 family peptidase [Gammaproteobacteria bacterium]
MKLPVLICSVFLLLLSVFALADDMRPFERMDVFELEWVSSPKVSPDGRRVVYVRNSMDIMSDGKASRLWLINSDGSGNTPLTGRDTNESNPAWSPDGLRIAFTSKSDAGTEVYVVWVETGKAARLTQLNRSPKGISWSPDGTQIAFSMLVPEDPVVLVTAPEKPDDAEWSDKPRVTTRLKFERDGSGYIEPGYEHFFVISAMGGTPRQVTSGDFKHTGTPQWSRDGDSLIFSGNRNDDWEYEFRNSEIYSVSIKTGEFTALTDRNGPDAEPVVSPDGRQIAYWSIDDKVQTYQVSKLQIMNADGSGKRELLSDFDRSISSLVWSRDSNGVYYQYDDHGDTKVGFTSLAGKSRVIATNLGGTTIGRPYGGGSFSVSDNGTVAYTHVTPYRPGELAIVDRRRADAEVITSFNSDLLDWRTLGKVEELWYKSSVDGRDIQGWVVLPPGHDAANPYPLLVENHGGPISNYGPRFSPEVQLYAAAGYVVFYPNPRGSTSYGEEFGNLLYHDYPGNDYQDVMDGVDVLIESGVTAEDRLYVTGGSAGGIMTAWIIGKNERFRAAAVVKPVMNWISKTLTADNYFQYANYRYPGQPWENIETYMKYSPVSLVGNIETPTMVMVGTADLRTPISESKQLYSALKIRGIDTVLVEVPDAPHNISGRPSQLITKIDHILAWFAKYPSE